MYMDSFLDLRVLELGSFLYPGLAKLLLSATSLVGLYLRQILYSTDMLPEAIVPALSMRLHWQHCCTARQSA